MKYQQVKIHHRKSTNIENTSSGKQQDSSKNLIPRNDLLGKKYELISKQFPFLLPGYHDAIISVGHKGMII